MKNRDIYLVTKTGGSGQGRQEIWGSLLRLCENYGAISHSKLKRRSTIFPVVQGDFTVDRINVGSIAVESAEDGSSVSSAQVFRLISNCTVFKGDSNPGALNWAQMGALHVARGLAIINAKSIPSGRLYRSHPKAPWRIVNPRVKATHDG